MLPTGKYRSSLYFQLSYGVFNDNVVIEQIAEPA